MRTPLAFFVLMIFFAIGACAPRAAAIPAPPPATEPAAFQETQIPTADLSTAAAQSPAWQQYTNSEFGLSFQFPPEWFGPEEFVSDQMIRTEIGTDKVYPYGTDPAERIDAVKNSYHVVIQFSRNDQNTFCNDTFQSLVSLQDGESLSGPRSLIIRVRQLELGRFKGFEYITTLSEAAQTEPVHLREVILVDEQYNLLTILGTPSSVEISDGRDWREVYRMMDEAYRPFFHKIVESITVE